MTLHAGTREREILDRILTDSRYKWFARENLEQLIIEIVGDITIEMDEIVAENVRFEDENYDLKQEVAELKEKLRDIRAIIDS